MFTTWAYDFSCGQTIRAIRDAFNAAGPWPWQVRESEIFGDYLNTRPDPHIRVSVHQYTQMWHGQAVGARSDKDFAASLQIDDTGSATRADVDTVFLTLLQAIDAEKVTEIGPCD